MKTMTAVDSSDRKIRYIKDGNIKVFLSYLPLMP